MRTAPDGDAADGRREPAAEALRRAMAATPLRKTCFATLAAHALPEAWNESAPTLAARFPLRCEGGTSAYDKSLAVVANCDFVGLHVHGACRGDATRHVRVDPAIASVHHYTGLFGQVRRARAHGQTAPGALWCCRPRAHGALPRLPVVLLSTTTKARSHEATSLLTPRFSPPPRL